MAAILQRNCRNLQDAGLVGKFYPQTVKNYLNLGIAPAVSHRTDAITGPRTQLTG
jgi:hypothetical protein